MYRKFSFPFILLASIALSSCDISTGKIKTPEYNNDKFFSFYSYACPNNGYYTIDGRSYPGKMVDNKAVSFQTVEKYKEYNECGFDTLLIDADDAYVGEEFSTSKLKTLLDMAYEAGLKAILFDNRIYTLSTKNTPIVGSGLLYENQTALENYISNCLASYKDHPAFYGLLIKDEPSYQNLDAIGSIFKAVKVIAPKVFLQCNLFPLSPGNYAAYRENAKQETVISDYKWYLNKFMEVTGSSYIMADSYPMKIQSDADIIDPNHLKTIQLLCETAKQFNADVYAVAQSSSWKNRGLLRARKCSESDMYWQTNFYMGMGIKQISYFTYQTKKTNRTDGEYFVDGASFIKWNGDKTEMYDYMKRIHSEMQKLAPAILNYEYQGLNFYKNGLPDVSYFGGVNVVDEFKKIESVKTSNNSVCLVTELFDKDKNLYMYMFLNTANPSTNQNYETVTVDFKDCDAISIYNKGENEGKKVSKSYSLTLNPGEANFIIPFNL